MAPGDVQVARIQLSSYPTDVSVAVVLAVNGPSTPPPVAISPARVDFGTLIPGQYAISYHSLALSTAADVTITTDADWIDVRPVSAKGVTAALISVVPVTPKMNGFKEYIGTIEVRAGSAAPVQIPVTARLASPEAPVTETTAPASTEAPFTDVPADAWVATARANGLIGGFPDRTFRPRDPVTRAQIAVLLQRASLICGVSTEPGCAAPMGRADQTLAGATLGGPRSQAESALGIATEERSGYANSYTTIYDDGHVTVQYVTPSDTVWSVRVVGEGATPRGIKIGDTVEAVRKAYGPQGELKNGVLTYRTGADFDFFYIQFFIVEGKVHSILLTQSK